MDILLLSHNIHQAVWSDTRRGSSSRGCRCQRSRSDYRRCWYNRSPDKLSRVRRLDVQKLQSYELKSVYSFLRLVHICSYMHGRLQEVLKNCRQRCLYRPKSLFSDCQMHIIYFFAFWAFYSSLIMYKRVKNSRNVWASSAVSSPPMLSLYRIIACSCLADIPLPCHSNRQAA